MTKGATDAALDGRWGNGEGFEYSFHNGSWEYSWHDGKLPVARGTFSAAAGAITMTRTHVRHAIAGPPLMLEPGPEWYSGSGLKSAMLAQGFPPETADEAAQGFFAPQTELYSVDGDVLVLTLFGEAQTWTRK